MTQPSLRPPSNVQPRPKAVPTSSSTSLTPNPISTTPQVSRPASKSRQASPLRHGGPSDVSEKATAALIRRILCPHSHGGTAEPRPINEILPPLTSSNEVDLQLYAIIAIIVKDLVYSWYGKITPDQSFVEEVVRIIAHCTTQLESRLRTIDLEGLCFDEIPALVEDHIQAYRVSRPSDKMSPVFTAPRVIYHNLYPHPALTPVPDTDIVAAVKEQQDHEAEYRQLLVQGALAVLLPTEDLENPCLRTLVTDVIAETILGNSVGGKVCEGWFIWESLTKLVEAVRAKAEPRATGEQIEVDTRSRLEKFGLLADKSTEKAPSTTLERSIFSSVFWRVLQYTYLTFLAVRFVIIGFATAYSTPLRSATTSKSGSTGEKSPMITKADSVRKIRPILSFKLLSLCSILLDLPQRMPWLSGSLALLRHHLTGRVLRVGATDGIIDQYLHYLVITQFDPSTLLPKALALVRKNLFPHATLPPPAPPPPSEHEVIAIKRACAVSLLELVPTVVWRKFFGSQERELWIQEVEGELDVWGDAYLNRHLAYAVLELIVVRILPELAEKPVEGLMRERIGSA